MAGLAGLAWSRRASFACKVAYLLAGHFASARRASFTCKVAYHPVGHLASSQRASFICKVANRPAGHFASARRASFTCKVAYHPAGHFGKALGANRTYQVAANPGRHLVSSRGAPLDPALPARGGQGRQERSRFLAHFCNFSHYASLGASRGFSGPLGSLKMLQSTCFIEREAWRLASGSRFALRKCRPERPGAFCTTKMQAVGRARESACFT